MYLFPILSILFSASIAKKLTGSWFSPGSFYALFWFFFTVLPLIFASEFIVELYGIWFIAIMVMSCVSGSIIAKFLYRQVVNDRSNFNLTFQTKLIYFLFLFNIISIYGLLELISYIGDVYSQPYYSDMWSFVPNLISIDRYSGNLYYPIILKYSLYFIYPANILGGILINQKVKSRYFILNCILPVLLSITLGIIEGSRTSFLLGSILFISSWLSIRITIYNGKLNLSYARIFSILSFFIVLFIFLFVFVQWLRQGLNPIIIELLALRLKTYFFLDIYQHLQYGLMK